MQNKSCKLEIITISNENPKEFVIKIEKIIGGSL